MNVAPLPPSSPPGTPPVPPIRPAVRRRTQAERSAETQARILKATVECLVDVGYGATTTIEVAKRAGVSRGAMLHHFPSRQELVTTAIVHVFRELDGEFRSAITRLPPDHSGGPVGATIDILWDAIQKPVFTAWLELVVASRTEAELRPAVFEMQESLRRHMQDTFTRIAVNLKRPMTPQTKIIPDLIFTLLDGLMLRGIASRDGLRVEGKLIRDILKTWVHQILTA